MGRYYEISIAFQASVKVDGRGGRIATTADFVAELERVNHHWTLQEANRWIEHYQSSFRDISTEEGERRTFQIFNQNNGGY